MSGSYETISKPRKWWLAGLLTIVQPGLGQIYNGQALKGVALFVIVWVFLPIPASLVLAKYPSAFALLLLCALGLAILVGLIGDAVANARKAANTYALKPYNRVLVYVGIFIAFSIIGEAQSWFVKSYIISRGKIPASSMEPTLVVGDFILVDKLHGARIYPHRGDVIVFEYPADPEKLFIKRVEGIAGDAVEITNKVLYLNGAATKAGYAFTLDPSVIPATFSPRDNYGPKVVPAESVFVLGDNRDRSLDSRFFGFIGKDKIRGIAKCIYFSWDGDSSSVRWDRIGKEIH